VKSVKKTIKAKFKRDTRAFRVSLFLVTEQKGGKRQANLYITDYLPKRILITTKSKTLQNYIPYIFPVYFMLLLIWNSLTVPGPSGLEGL
jgi:hypothetical protein